MTYCLGLAESGTLGAWDAQQLWCVCLLCPQESDWNSTPAGDRNGEWPGVGYTMDVCTGEEVLESTEHESTLKTVDPWQPYQRTIMYSTRGALCSGTGVLVSVTSSRTLQINWCIYPNVLQCHLPPSNA